MTDTITTTTTQGVVLTDVAADKVKSLIASEGRDDLVLRIAVQPGGCSGLRYQLELDDRSFDGDVVSEFGGVKVAIDKMSAPYLNGAEIGFADTISQQGFTIDNPNASNSCACGDSFH
jgi:iron-sulfur cluster assembly accessory protein